MMKQQHVLMTNSEWTPSLVNVSTIHETNNKCKYTENTEKIIYGSLSC